MLGPRSTILMESEGEKRLENLSFEMLRDGIQSTLLTTLFLLKRANHSRLTVASSGCDQIIINSTRELDSPAVEVSQEDRLVLENSYRRIASY